MRLGVCLASLALLVVRAEEPRHLVYPPPTFWTPTKVQVSGGGADCRGQLSDARDNSRPFRGSSLARHYRHRAAR